MNESSGVMIGSPCWNCDTMITLPRAVDIVFRTTMHHFWCKTCNVKWNDPGIEIPPNVLRKES